MKKLLATLGVFAVVLASALVFVYHSHGQNLPPSRFGHVFDAKLYSAWGASVAVGNAATGSQTITVCPAFVVLPDGRSFNPFSTSTPITIDPQSSTVAETVTPTAVSQVAAPASAPTPNSGVCENVTATFANTHGISLNNQQVISGDAGANEATLDAASAGGGIILPILSTGAITPTATAAAVGTVVQTFTLTGVPTTSNAIIPVSFPAQTALCPMVGARVTAANQVGIEFAVLTAAACTPAAGTYTFLPAR